MLGISIEILGFSLEILGIPKICGNRTHSIDNSTALPINNSIH